MNTSCDIVMDLVGLYCDGSASPASISAVEEHLKDCPSCRQFYRHYRTMMKQRQRAEEAAGRKAGDFSVLASRLRKRRTLIAACLAVYSCAVAAVVVYGLLQDKEKTRE
jgi:predicted anti-sigma-YlaC factor YlaD